MKFIILNKCVVDLGNEITTCKNKFMVVIKINTHKL